MDFTTSRQPVVIVGAGPAGLFAARFLATNHVPVILLNRDIKPGGLAEYGIYYNKYKMKAGLRKQFHQILNMPEIEYFGNVTVGENGNLSLDDIRDAGCQTILITAGAQGTKWLGLPGEDLDGVYHAKDIVYHYNSLPPYSRQDFHVHGKVAIIGVGNVMMDIAHWAIHDLRVDEVIAIARRGPAEVKFTRKEMEYVAANLDVSALDTELARCADQMTALGQDLAAARAYILEALPNALPTDSSTRLRFEFLESPTRIIGDKNGRVCGLEVEDTRLELRNGETKAKGTGTHHVLQVDSVVYCIGDRVDAGLGLPVQWNAFVKNSQPCFPIDGNSYEVLNPEKNQPLDGVFVAGWSREASSGLVGMARKDGENGARAVLNYLNGLTPLKNEAAISRNLHQLLAQKNVQVVTLKDLHLLEQSEQEEANRRGLEDFKYATNEEMFAVITESQAVK